MPVESDYRAAGEAARRQEEEVKNTSRTDNVKVTPAEYNPKRWWERPLGIIALGILITVIGGLILWAVTRHYDKPTPSTAVAQPTIQPQPQAAQPAAPPLSSPTSTKPTSSRQPKPVEPIHHPTHSSPKAQTPSIGSINQGAGSALSINQKGGITAGTIIGTPPCQWSLLTDRDFIKMAQLLSSSRAKIYIAIPPSNNEAARFAGYLQPALKTISHWDADDFDTATGDFWAKYPGITVIARDENDFSDLTKPAAKLKNAIQSIGLTVHTKQVASLKKDDDLGLWVNTCE